MTKTQAISNSSETQPFNEIRYNQIQIPHFRDDTKLQIFTGLPKATDGAKIVLELESIIKYIIKHSISPSLKYANLIVE